ERADLHRRVLDVLEARGHSDAGLLAHHAARARFEPGDVRPVALAVGAAQEALARRHRVVALMERRDLHGVDAEVAAFARRAERLGDPLYTWYAPMWRAMRAHADGRLDEAEALSRQARAIGEAGGSVNAPLPTGCWRSASPATGATPPASTPPGTPSSAPTPTCSGCPSATS